MIMTKEVFKQIWKLVSIVSMPSNNVLKKKEMESHLSVDLS